MTVDISVVIPAYNADAYLRDCLGGLRQQTLAEARFEVILVDDGSRDKTLATAQRLKEELAFHHLKIVHQDNAGPAAARNHGITLASAEILAFLDSDCVPHRQWLENLLAPFLENPGWVGVEGKTVPASEQRTLMDHYIDNPHGGFFWTCNIAYRKSALLEIGGFDEGFPLPSGEDIDLAHRIRRKGAIGFAPYAMVAHLILKRSFRQHLATARTFSSMIRLQRKHPGLLNRGSSFLELVLYQLKSLLLPMLTQRREVFKAPMAYVQFCLLQSLMAVDTLCRLPHYYREAVGPLELREPFGADNGL